MNRIDAINEMIEIIKKECDGTFLDVDGWNISDPNEAPAILIDNLSRLINKITKDPTETAHDKEDMVSIESVIKEKRFHAACFAMQGIIANGIYDLNEVSSIDDIVFDSYKLADGILKQGGYESI